MSEPAQKCENNAIFKQNYTLELFIALIMLLFGLKGKSRFSRFPPKKSFITSTPEVTMKSVTGNAYRPT